MTAEEMYEVLTGKVVILGGAPWHKLPDEVQEGFSDFVKDIEARYNPKGKNVYVVYNHYLLGTALDSMHENEEDALRCATEKQLPGGVYQRSVAPFVIQ